MNKIEVYIDGDGIMHAEYPPHAGVTFDNVREEYEARLEITSNKTPLLVKIHGVAAFDKDAREFLCGAQHSEITSAAAIISDSKSGYYEYSSMLLELFRGINKPPFDCKVFEHEEDALTWLRSYL